MSPEILEQLDKIDAYFADKNNKNLYFIGACVFAIFVGVLAIEPNVKLLLDQSAATLKQAEDNYNGLEEPEVINAKIKKAEEDIEKNKERLTQLEEINGQYNEKFISFANKFPKPEGINAYLNNVAQQAAFRNVKVERIDNFSKENFTPRKLEAMYDVNLTFSTSRFEPIVRYFYDLESEKDINDIRYLEIRSDVTGLKGIFNVVAWGFQNE